MNTLSNKTEEDTVVIEIATPEDAEAIASIQRSVWLATYPNEELGISVADIESKQFNSPERIEKWRQKITQRKDRMTWVAKNHGRLIGFCFVVKQETENYLEALYIQAEHQHQGIGKKLMHVAEAWLGKNKPISLGVATYNTQAITFYQKLGFEISSEPPTPIPPLPSGKIIPILKMTKHVFS